MRSNNVSLCCAVIVALTTLLVGRTGAAAASRSGTRIGSELSVSGNGRYLVRRDGKPFFWLGDTAWLLSQVTTREEAELYLGTRAKQGFTVIQAAIVVPDSIAGIKFHNRYGDAAFVDGDMSRPLVTPGNSARSPDQYDFWDHVDYLVDRAAAHRLTLGLLPLFVGWGGDGYRDLTPENARAYGRFLGRRYRMKSNVVWILGGDNVPDTKARQDIWHRLARGIAEGTSGEEGSSGAEGKSGVEATENYTQTLMTYHISGGSSSSQWFHTAPWLDMNMCQVWGDEKSIYPAVSRDYVKTPVKPAGLGEGSYEDGPQYGTRPIDAHKVRKQAYWSYMAGGYHTYGNTNTWNFGTRTAEVTQDWKEALHSPGAASLTVLKRFFTSFPWWKLVPDQSVFASGVGSGDTLNAAMRSASGDRLVIYLSSPTTVTVRLDRLAGAKNARATWTDPRTGVRSAAGRYATAGVQPFTVPAGWPDALLVVHPAK